MVTFRSVERLGRDLFSRVLESSLSVPYRSLVLVDDSPTPETAEVVKSFAESRGKELVVLRSRLYGGATRHTRATARQTAVDAFLENFTEEWLMFLDDDFVLGSGYWAEASAHLADPSVGEVWGVNWDAHPERRVFIGLLHRARLTRTSYAGFLVEGFQRRGGTHDTLYRRQAVSGVLIPPELHVYEDAWLHHYVRCRGWESRVVYDSGLHYSPAGDLPLEEEKRSLLEAVRIAVKYGIAGDAHVLETLSSGGSTTRWILGWLGLARPVLGLPFQAVASYRQERSVPRAVARALRRQYLKAWIRYVVLREARRIRGRVPDVCEVVLSHAK
ncbi:glycosyl transferase, family 2 [Desulfurococcus amylolyticus 1221n]|uniref:Glycosyl transferase, family 2 n=2 Tax=Desulfurococcus amylolyticus TaxID=94694 RepID=B8D3F7_DESA1|nr:glycosyl transferase, family 2 [Desulfurococcus amylolyticus 1221n]